MNTKIIMTQWCTEDFSEREDGNAWNIECFLVSSDTLKFEEPLFDEEIIMGEANGVQIDEIDAILKANLINKIEELGYDVKPIDSIFLPYGG